MRLGVRHMGRWQIQSRERVHGICSALLTMPMILLLVISSLLLSTPSIADNEADVRLVIDISGSMKRNDPQNLRQPAVEMLMELLPDGSHAGVWAFGKEVNMLVPFGTVDQRWREMATERAKNINSVGLYTNIGGALEKASQVSPASQKNAHIILLTDGMVDIDKDPSVNEKEWRRIVDEIIPVLKKQGFSVHTVALSDNADTHLMNKLSLATGGHAGVAKTADDLMPAFLKAFDAASPSQQLPLAGNRFVVDSSIEEFTALMFRDSSQEIISLVGPDDTVINEGDLDKDIAWHHTDNYDLVTITRPLEGEWEVKGALAKGSRITVVSDLNLRVKPLPLQAPVGSELDLQLALQEDNQVVSRADFLKLLTIEAASGLKASATPSWQYTFDTQNSPKRGIFSTKIKGFVEPGDYLVSVKLDGKSFKRKFSHQLKINMPFTADLIKGYNDNSQMQFVLFVRKNAEHIRVKNTQIALTLSTPDRRKHVLPLKLNATEEWTYAIIPEQSGVHKLVIRIAGIDNNGDEFEYIIDDLSFNYAPSADFESLLLEEQSDVETMSSEASTEPEQEDTQSREANGEDDARNIDPKESAADDGAPWVLYTALGIGNLLLLIGGFFAFKKMLRSTSDIKEEPTLQPEESSASKEPSPEPQEDNGDAGPMQMQDLEDEIPPMEDLEPDLNFDENPETSENTDQAAVDDTSRVDEDFDFDLSALDGSAASEPDGEVEGQLSKEPEALGEPDVETQSVDELFDTAAAVEAGIPEEPEEDMAQAMLKAQGLDLAEDELDDAISNLIDELDEPEATPLNKTTDAEKGAFSGEINLDDFDFDDEDDK